MILPDIYLRGEDGGDVCKEIKQIQHTIPIILVPTNNRLKQLADACVADDYIEKAFGIHHIMNKVSQWGNIYESLKPGAAK